MSQTGASPEPASGAVPAPLQGPARTLVLAGTGLAIVVYLLGFFSPLSSLLYGPALVLAGGLLGAAALLPRASGRVLVPGAVLAVVGFLSLVQVAAAAAQFAVGGIEIVALVVAFLAAAALAGGVLMEAGLLSMPERRPQPPQGQYGPYGQQYGGYPPPGQGGGYLQQPAPGGQYGYGWSPQGPPQGPYGQPQAYEGGPWGHPQPGAQAVPQGQPGPQGQQGPPVPPAPQGPPAPHPGGQQGPPAQPGQPGQGQPPHAGRPGGPESGAPSPGPSAAPTAASPGGQPSELEQTRIEPPRPGDEQGSGRHGRPEADRTTRIPTEGERRDG
jgi:hypothetical protein